MTKLYALAIMVISVFLLVSYSIDPPGGKTGAPGESNCAECHKPQSQVIKGTIAVEGFPDTVEKDSTYTLTVVNRNTEGDAVKGGFQMTVLGPLNTRAGELSSPMPSPGSVIQTSGGRQYFEHHPAATYPDSNVLRWTVRWKASNISTSGKVTAYVAGNIVNGNFQSTGDFVALSKASGDYLLTASKDISISKAELFPNPGCKELYIRLKNNTRPDGLAYFYNTVGIPVATYPIQQGVIQIPFLPTGLYWIRINADGESFFEKWIKSDF